jgi:hypothetical protein
MSPSRIVFDADCDGSAQVGKGIRQVCGLAVLTAALVAGARGRAASGPADAQKEPRPAATEPASQRSTVSFVVLPPELPRDQAGLGDSVGLFCDLLAQRLSKSPGVAVLDRTRLDRVLAERAIGGTDKSPMLSFDAMVRVRPEGADGNQEIAVDVVDLALGNLAASGKWSWRPGSDEAVSKAADLCASACNSLAGGPGNRLKVRVLHLPQPLRTARVEAFGDGLASDLAGLLEHSPRVRVVRHLEAMSAKEESLLLLLGLTRLGGGRVFAPQADLALELRLTERDAVGKTFDQTPIEAAASLNWAGKDAEKVTVAGTPGGRAELLRRIHAELARHIEGLDGQGQGMAESTLRRKQAIAELKRSDKWDLAAYNAGRFLYWNNEPKGQPLYQSERIKEMADIASAAAKIDPTYEEAAFQAAKFGFVHLMTAGSPADGSPALREALNYLRRFNEAPDHLADIVTLVGGGLSWRNAMNKKVPFSNPHQIDPDCWYDYVSGYWAPGPKAARGPVELLREIIDLTLAQEAKACPHLYYGSLIWATHLGMIDTGMNPAEARQWRDEANMLAMNRLRRAVAGPKPDRISQMGGRGPYSAYSSCCNHLSLAMHWANKEKGPEHAKALLEEFMAAGPPAKMAISGADTNLSNWARELKDADLEKRYRAWAERDSSPFVPYPKALCVRWPTWTRSKLYDQAKAAVKDPSRYLLAGRADREVLWKEVGFQGSRLYVLYWLKSGEQMTDWPDGLGWIEGPDAPAAQGPRDVTVHPAAAFPVPARELVVSCWAVTDSRVALGTGSHGILVFDPNSATWRGYGPAQGLPLANVGSLHSLPQDTLLAWGAGGAVRQHDETDVEEEAIYTFNLTDGQVRLLNRLVVSDRKGRVEAFRKRTKGLCQAWPIGQELAALGRYNVLRDALGPSPRIEPWRMAAPLPWKRPPALAWPDVTAQSAVEAGGQLLVHMREGLVQFDAAFKPVAQWRVNAGIVLAESVGGYDDDTERMAVIPGDVPTGYAFDMMGGGGDWAVIHSGHTQLLLLHVPTHTWYGPVALDAPIYDRGIMEMTCAVKGDLLTAWGCVLSIERIVQAAKAAKCCWTDQQFRQMQTDLLLAQPPRDALKFALLGRRFDDARRLLDKQSPSGGDDPELLLLAAWLHEKPNLNDLTKAEMYYRRLADMKDVPGARLRGMISLCYFLNSQGRLDEAMRIADDVRGEFHTASAGTDSPGPYFDRLVRAIRSRLGKQPAPAASNRQMGKDK